MKLKNLLYIAAFALASVASSCDDHEYTTGPASAGVYFPDTNPATVNVQPDEQNFIVTIRRTEAKGDATVNITSKQGEDNLFSIPATVTFAEESLVAELIIEYDPQLLELKVDYPISLSIAKELGTTYGTTEYEFVVNLKATLQSYYWGFGSYSYNSYITGEQESIPCYKGHYEGEIETDSVMVVGGLPKGQTDMRKFVPWYAGFAEVEDQVLEIVMHYGEKLQNSAGEELDYIVPCEIVSQPIGINTSSYGQIMIADYKWFAIHSEDPDLMDAYSDWGLCSYDMRTGTFDLPVLYYGEAMTGLSIFSWGQTEETLQLDGFPNYDIEVKFAGLYTSADFSQTYATLDVETGKNLQEVWVGIGQGEDAAAVRDAILNGTISHQVIGGNTTERVECPISATGEFFAVAIGFDNDVQVNAQGARFIVGDGTVIPNNPDDWKSLGLCDYYEAFLLPVIYRDYKWRGYDHEGNLVGYNKIYGSVQNFIDYNVYQCEIQQNKQNPGVFRLINPYGPGSEWVYEENNNVNPNHIFNIEINAENPDCVYVLPQKTGFGMRQYNERTQFPYMDEIYNLEGSYIVQGNTTEEIYEALTKAKYNISNYTEEDGIGTLTIQNCYPTTKVYNSYFRNPPTQIKFVLDKNTEAAAKFASESALRHIRSVAQQRLFGVGFTVLPFEEAMQVGTFHQRPMLGNKW